MEIAEKSFVNDDCLRFLAVLEAIVKDLRGWE